MGNSLNRESKKIYSLLNPSVLFMIQRRQRIFQKIFADNFPEGLSDIKLLEIGCGSGQWLIEFAMFGFKFANFAGIEIEPRRAKIAMERVPNADIREGDASSLPWPDQSFDIVFQSTVFTSVTDSEKKKKIAGEMKRVCKEGGIILWYDFKYNNPSNPNVRGVGRSEIKELFAPWRCEFQSVTLAPLIARKVVPLSWSIAEDLETFFPFLRTHLVVVIRTT
ncbi:MAG TPA: class I SAM-dependent methyltransferase [Victivallales bacterium]|nr:class I SAM-dependent methyltransferase [Victivallales bacterium]HRR06171.1 class I SAM-dependent methyltransferase [Victivallales bacterium]HRR28489.1 class I SAM-dependent methyltransferase [Victivallales bacterium]